MRCLICVLPGLATFDNQFKKNQSSDQTISTISGKTRKTVMHPLSKHTLPSDTFECDQEDKSGSHKQ